MGPDDSFTAKVSQFLSAVSLVILGLSHHNIREDPRSIQYQNAFNYFYLRTNREYTVLNFPSEIQSGLSCGWHTACRATMLMCGLPVDEDVKCIEQNGLQFLGELGFFFKRGGRFTLTELRSPSVASVAVSSLADARSAFESFPLVYIL